MVRLIPVSDDKVAALLRAGRDANELAAEWGITPQGVRRAARAGGYSPGHDAIKVLPVSVTGPRAFAPAARGLRALARVRKGEESELTAEDLTRFTNWKRERDETGTVVEYDEDYPPNPASPTHGGWHYEKRRPSTPKDEYFQDSV